MNTESPNPGSARPSSPCISICTLDDNSACLGCRRTLDEIVGWSTMSAVDQWRVIRRISATPRSDALAEYSGGGLQC